MPNTYKAIIFDLYGTLLDIHTDEEDPKLWERLAHFYNMHGAYYTPQSLKMAYAQHVKALLKKQQRRGIDVPDIEILKVFKRLFKAAGVKASPQLLQETARLFRILSLDYVRPYPGALALLETLRRKGYKILLLSNAQRAFTMDELQATGLLPNFDRIFLSSDYRVSKPSPRFFKVLLNAEGLKASECLFVGNDHVADIGGAQGVGMASVYLHTNCSRSDAPESTGADWEFWDGDLEGLRALFKSE